MFWHTCSVMSFAKGGVTVLPVIFDHFINSLKKYDLGVTVLKEIAASRFSKIFSCVLEMCWASLLQTTVKYWQLPLKQQATRFERNKSSFMIVGVEG